MARDSIRYLLREADIIWSKGDYIERQKVLERAYKLDSINYEILCELGHNFLILGEYQQALKYFQIFIETGTAYRTFYWRNASMTWMGFAYWQSGFTEKADTIFNQVITNCEKEIDGSEGTIHVQYTTCYDEPGEYNS